MRLIVPPGTRIVAEGDVVVGETGATMPAGAVGVIVRSPSDGTHAYRVRFPDGGEASLRRPEFRILKTVRETGVGEGIPIDVDWMQFVIYRCVVGSRAFGLETEESDGPEYTSERHLNRLRHRGLSGKRSLALREFSLGIEALERFVAREPLRRVHECVFGVLALESEPVDPRL